MQLRLSNVMEDIVSVYKTCSVSGRSIKTNLRLLRDIVDYLKLRRDQCDFISMDQHKAFDKMEWNFLFSSVTEVKSWQIFYMKG